MAEGGAGRDPVDWTEDYYPLLWLPFHVRMKIADVLDAATGVRGIEMFAEMFGFTQGVAYMRERCRCLEFQHSVTMFLFAELASRRNPPSIQQIYSILYEMDSVAADIIIIYLPDIIRIQNRNISDGQQNSESSFCPCRQCESDRNQSRQLSGHHRNRSNSGPRQSDDQTLYPTNNSRNTRSVQTDTFHYRQPTPHYPQDLPSVRQRPGDYHSRSPFNVPTQNSDYYYQNNPVNQPGSSRHSNMQRQISLPVRPEHQRYSSLQLNLPSWIPPSTYQPLNTSVYSEQHGDISQSSGQDIYRRSKSEPEHPSVPLNVSVSNSVRTRRRTGSEYESRGNRSEHEIRRNESRRNGSEYDSRTNRCKHESMRNGSDCESRTNRNEHENRTNTSEHETRTKTSEHENRTNTSEHESRTRHEHESWGNRSEHESRTRNEHESRINESQRNGTEYESRRNGNEGVDFVRNDCQKCRLVADNEETMVLTLVSELESSCSFHSNRQCGDGMAHSQTYPQLQTLNVPRSSTIPESLNSANMNASDQTSRKGTYLDDNNEMEHNVSSFIETNSSLNADTHETARKTVFVSDAREDQEVIDSSETGADRKDETKRMTTYLDHMFADAGKENYLDEINDNEVETARKTTYLEDLDAENEQTSRKRGHDDERLISSTGETARKTSYSDEIHDKSNILDENGDKFEGLVSNCPMCEEENRMRELRDAFESCQIHDISHCTCHSHEHRTYSICDRNTQRVTQNLGCGQSQAEAQRHVTGQSSLEPVTGQSSTDSEVPEANCNRKDGRHSWHEGEQNDSRDSLSSSRLSISDSSIELVYCRNSSVSQSSISSTGSSGGTQSSNSSAKPVVLVTFSVDPDQGRAKAHLQEVYHLIKRMKEAGIRVRVDMDRDAFRRNRWNRQDWLDKNLSKVKFVVTCISPEYADDIKPPPVDGAVAHVSQLNARYIFDYMRREYYDNRAQNRRLIPILFPNSGAQYGDVPQCMTATKIYTYSEDVEEVIRIIKR